MKRLVVTVVACIVALSVSRSAYATNTLYLAWDPETAACEAKVSRFFGCILGHSNFNALIEEYSQGTPLVVGGTVVLNGSCTPKDAQCIATLSGFSLADGDVLVEFIGSTLTSNGSNASASVTTGGRAATIKFAWIQSGNDCDWQTCGGTHEVFEAATDGVSADCCNGQVPHECLNCDPSCGRRVGRANTCYSLTCDGEPFSAAFVGAAQAEFVPLGCTEMAPAACTGMLRDSCVNDAQCCGALACGTVGANARKCCAPIDRGCIEDADCCAARCDSATHTCACGRSQTTCLGSADCCSGLACEMGVCAAVPMAPDAGAATATTASRGCAIGTGASRATDEAPWSLFIVVALLARRARRRR